MRWYMHQAASSIPNITMIPVQDFRAAHGDQGLPAAEAEARDALAVLLTHWDPQTLAHTLAGANAAPHIAHSLSCFRQNVQHGFTLTASQTASAGGMLIDGSVQVVLLCGTS